MNESATNVEVVQDESINSVQSLSQEATTINQIFSQQVLVKVRERRIAPSRLGRFCCAVVHRAGGPTCIRREWLSVECHKLAKPDQ